MAPKKALKSMRTFNRWSMAKVRAEARGEAKGNSKGQCRRQSEEEGKGKCKGEVPSPHTTDHSPEPDTLEDDLEGLLAEEEARARFTDWSYEARLARYKAIFGTRSFGASLE